MKAIRELERREALEILRKMVIPRHAWRLLKKISVASVCIGMKLTKGQKSDGNGLCIKIIVHRKGIFNQNEEIPPRLYVTHPEYGKIMVETDVEDAGRLQLNSLDSPLLEAGEHTGSIACGLRHSSGRRYLVTARHVLDDVDDGENNGTVTWTKEGLSGEGIYNNASNWYYDKDPTNNQSGYVDVGLVDLAGNGNDAIYFPGSHLIPQLESTVDWGRCEDHDLVRICGHEHIVYGQYAGQLSTGTPIFIDGKGFPYWRMITYFLDRDALTIQGDSGAAVFDEATGALVGMHLGMRETENGFFALALCSGDIFRFLEDRIGGSFNFIG